MEEGWRAGLVRRVANGPGFGSRVRMERHRGRGRLVVYGTGQELERRVLMMCGHRGRAMGRREERELGRALERTVANCERLQLRGGLWRNDRLSRALLKPCHPVRRKGVTTQRNEAVVDMGGVREHSVLLPDSRINEWKL